MNCKHLSKISVLYTNANLPQSHQYLQVLTRQLGKSSNPSHQHEFQVSRRKSNFPKKTIQAKPLPSSLEEWNKIGSSSDNCKSSDFKFLARTPSYKYDQRRNLSSLLQKIKNFLMSVLNSNSIPLLKAGKPVELKKDQANKLKASAPSSSATPSKSAAPQTSSPSLLQSLKIKPKEKAAAEKPVVESSPKKSEAEAEKSKLQELENEIKIKKSFGTGIGIAAEPELKDKKPDLVADSLMKETAQRLEVENKRKPPFEAGKGSFVEDRIATEMPKKRREKIELEQEMKERRVEEAEDADMYKVIDDAKQKPKKASAAVKKMDASKLCDHDDVFCGVEQFDDTEGGEVQKREGQATQILAAKKTKAMKKKTTQVFTSKGEVKPTGLVPKRGKGFEKNYSTSATTFEANRISPKDFSVRLSEVPAFRHYNENFSLRASKLKRLSDEDFHQTIWNTNTKSNDIADGTPMIIIQKDPLETFEQKEPKPVVEVKDPDANFFELIEPINNESFEDPFRERPLIAESKKIAYGRDAKEEVKKEDEKRKKERKAACNEENRSRVIEEPCSQNKPLCCYNPPKRLLETDLTDKCNAKCSVAPQKPPPVMDCSLCKRYETLKDDVPKPKPMVCKVSKCSKPTQECPPSDGPKSANLPRRPELCGSSCTTSKKDCDKAKAKAEGKMSSCGQQKCTQKTCPKKEKAKPVVCPAMPKACMSKPKEKQGKECKKKTCPTINAASRNEEANKKKKEAEKRKEREKKCSPKKKKSDINTCKALSECEKEKLKAEEDKKRAEEEAKNAGNPKVHTEWKAVPIKGPGRWCDKEGGKQERAEPTSKTVTPNMQKKYQSPRYDKKRVCDDKPSTENNEHKGTKKCIPIGILDVSQSLGAIENSLYLSNVCLESDDGSGGNRNKKSPKVPPPALAAKSKSDSKAIPFHFDNN